MENSKSKKALASADRDLVALGIATAAIILFVATASTVLPSTINAVVGGGNGPDKLLATATFLNIALVIFGWRRYRELQGEIIERRRAEALARELAETDPLTGCLNRRSMAVAIEDLRARAHAHGKTLVFCMIDLDNFKQINDLYGHSVGDKTLVELSQRITSQLPKGAIMARLGGDEFAFVAEYDPTRAEWVDDLVVRLFESITRSYDRGGGAIDTTVSIGLATDHVGSGDDRVSADELMQHADIAMYHAKKQGKNRYFWFEPSMENELRFRNELETGIRRGLMQRQFEPYYEQQVDLDTDELVGFEMLARWNSPELGMVSPEIFIPVAEELGIIGKLSDQLMAQAFADAREWAPSLTLSINVSPVQLRDPWFAQKLLKMLVDHQFPAHRLEIEITESCLLENIGMVRAIITSLRNQGIRISLDDFGTGYSSLEQLRTLPFDRLKIDRSFVSELNRPSSSSTIVDAIISLGRGLNLPMTAEGIEDESILEALKKLGKLKGQGYFYGKPESGTQVRERLMRAGKLAQTVSTLSTPEHREADTSAPTPLTANG